MKQEQCQPDGPPAFEVERLAFPPCPPSARARLLLLSASSLGGETRGPHKRSFVDPGVAGSGARTPTLRMTQAATRVTETVTDPKQARNDMPSQDSRTASLVRDDLERPPEPRRVAITESRQVHRNSSRLRYRARRSLSPHRNSGTLVAWRHLRDDTTKWPGAYCATYATPREQMGSDVHPAERVPHVQPVLCELRRVFSKEAKRRT